MDIDELLELEKFNNKKCQQLMCEMVHEFGDEKRLAESISSAYKALTSETFGEDINAMIIALALRSSLIEDDCDDWAVSVAEHLSYGNLNLKFALLELTK